MFLSLSGVIFGGTSPTVEAWTFQALLLSTQQMGCIRRSCLNTEAGCPQQVLGEHRDGVALRGPCKPCSLCLRQRWMQPFVRGDSTCSPHPGVLGKYSLEVTPSPGYWGGAPQGHCYSAFKPAGVKSGAVMGNNCLQVRQQQSIKKNCTNERNSGNPGPVRVGQGVMRAHVVRG